MVTNHLITVNTTMKSSRRRKGKRLRIEDIARMAGVAPTTVSRSFRKPEKVSQETRKKIDDVVRETGYIRDLMAGSLASLHSRLIALLVPTIANPVHSDIIQGVTDNVRPAGYEVLLGSTGYSPKIELDLLRAFVGRRADGIVLTGAKHLPEVKRIVVEANLPVVETWELPKNPLDMAVGFSNRQAAMAMTQYLLERGCKHPAIVGHDAPSDSRSADRVEGFLAVAARAGIAQPLVWLVPGPTTSKRGSEAMSGILNKHPETDSVFFVSDLMAVGGLLECQKRGLSVPNQIAIAGFGGSEITALTHPAITTVQIPRKEIGRRAAELLLLRLNGESILEPIIDVGYAVIKRDSA